MKKKQLKIKYVVGVCIGLSTTLITCQVHSANMQLSINKTQQPLTTTSNDSSQCIRDFARVSLQLARCKNSTIQYENCRINLLKAKQMLLNQSTATQNIDKTEDDDDSDGDDDIKYVDDEGNRAIPMF